MEKNNEKKEEMFNRPISLLTLDLPFDFCKTRGIPKSFGKGIAINFQLCDLKLEIEFVDFAITHSLKIAQKVSFYNIASAES